MHLNNLKSPLKFGKHSGRTLKEVAKIDLSYIKWCVENIEEFGVDQAAINFFETDKSGQKIKSSNLIILKERLKKYGPKIIAAGLYYTDESE